MDKYYSISPYAFCNNNPVNFVDLDGADPTLAARIVIGAAVGGLVSGTAAAIKGKSFTEVVAATAGGAADGAVSALGGKIATKLLSGMAGGGLGNLIEQQLNVFLGNQESVDRKEVVGDVILGGLTNGASETVRKHLTSMAKRELNSTSAREAIEKGIKGNFSASGRKVSRKMVTKMADDQMKELTNGTKKVVEISIDAIDYSIGFYQDILINDEQE